jgi:hypothetical protein
MALLAENTMPDSSKAVSASALARLNIYFSRFNESDNSGPQQD